MRYLGVPIVVGVRIFSISLPKTIFAILSLLIIIWCLQIHMIVVREEDYQVAIRKLEDSGFIRTAPDRRPAPEVMERLPDPQAVLDQINEGYKRLDQSSITFNYPIHYPEREAELFLIPNSFAHLQMSDMTIPSNATNQAVSTKNYDVYGNLFYPHEQVLVESLVKVAIDEEEEVGYSSWGELLRAWVSMMAGYLEVNNDILDNCADERAVEWYSTNFGRIREAKFGPLDRRITKRLGSGKEMPVDMRGNPIPG